MYTYHVACICPKCWKVTPIDISMGGQATHAHITYNRYNIRFNDELVMNSLRFAPICKFCERQDEWEDQPFIVDAGIANSIKRFNKLGLKTKYSCEGHIKADSDRKQYISVPYLMFEANEAITTIMHEAVLATNEDGYYPDLVQGEIGIIDNRQTSPKRIYYTYEKFKKLPKNKRNRVEYCVTLSDESVDNIYTGDDGNIISVDQFEYYRSAFANYLKVLYDHIDRDLVNKLLTKKG